MGLTVTLSNALSGMRTTQAGLEVLSRNVGNAGSPGYHRQSVNIQDMNGGSSSYARFVGVERAFSAALQRAHNQEVAASGFVDVRASFLARLEAAFGKPGDANSLDTVLQDFENSLHALSVSPEDYATRSVAVGSAQTLAQTLNGLSRTVQQLRQETENQMLAHVGELNHMLSTLETVNNKLADYSIDDTARMSMMDERDRLVASVSELVDAQVTYRPDGSVSIMTQSGLGLLDKGATVFEFEPAGAMSANALYNIDDSKNGVGSLIAFTPSGLKLDVFDQKIIQSGRLAALVEMRDTTLVQAQSQLDQIASALAQSFNVNDVAGTAVGGPPAGFDLDLTNVQPGNEVVFSYAQSGKTYDIKVLRVEDSSKLPMDYVNAQGERILCMSFSGGAAGVASQLNALFGPGIAISATGSTLEIRDDGGIASQINSAATRTTSTGAQGQGLGLSFFTDTSNAAFTNSLDGDTQARGFASRITVNSQIVSDNKLLVQYQAGGTLGDTARVDYMLNRLETTQFSPDKNRMPGLGDFRISGSVGSLVDQMLNYQGNQISAANSAVTTQEVALAAVEQRMEAEYGVNIDEEMARLMELQNSYAASARVVAVAQELIDSLLSI